MNDPGASILIVDDEPLNRKLFETMLKPEGYRTSSVSNGEDALASVALDKPDLILLDVMMPGMTGYQFASTLKANDDTSNIPIIMVTALVDRDARLSALEAGVEEFLTKPVNRAELWLRVRNLLRLKAMGDLLKTHGTILEKEVQERTADLRKKESQLSEALKIGRLAYWEYEYSTHEFIFNDQFYSLHKITVEEAGGYRMSSVDFALRYVHPEDASLISNNILRASESRDPDYFAMVETRLLTGDGEIFWVEARFKVEKNTEGRPIRLIGVNQNITERKISEESLRKLSLAVEESPSSVVITDLDGTIEYANESFFEITGYNQSEIIGQNPRILQSGHTPEATYADMWAHLNNNQTWKGEFINKRKDGSEYCEFSMLSPIHDSSGKTTHYLAIKEDITERKAAEVKIIYLNRVYAILSGINSLIVRANDREELFREACRIVVEDGEFHMAMLCMVDQQTKKIVPVATAGKDKELLSGIKEILASDERSPDTMVARVIREKQTLVANDSETDDRVLFGKIYAESGVRSMAIFPLIVGGETVGALALYSGIIEFFHEEELKLLLELANDISFAIDHIEKQDHINYLAYYDVLTGLARRALFLERLEPYMRSAVSNGHKLALCLIDLERFKNINDSLGRPTGDALLQQVAEWLTRNTGDANRLARIDADHFAIVLPEIRREGDLTRLVETLVRDFQKHPFLLNDSEYHIAARSGIALFPDDGAEAGTLFKNAEAALKKAKARGDQYLFYTQKMNETMASKLTLENQLRRAIDNEEFVLHYQPKVNLSSDKVTSAEALIRWNDPLTGLVPPGQFIPILEETGLIYEVGRWALRETIANSLRWRSADLPAIRIAVNVSASQLHREDFIAEIEQAISIDAHAAEGLELEITESMIMEDIERNIADLEVIRAMGITIAIDDFGTGFSSLSHLSRLPVDTLKIDRTFVVEIDVGPEGLALVSTIISLAHAFKLKVVAEGVETKEQSHLLRLLSCDEIQGFLFSKPMPCEEFESRFLAP